MAQEPRKREILEALALLPDEATVEDAIERLRQLSQLWADFGQTDAGEGLDPDEVTRRFQR
ncbi:MAG: hypothetical protein EXR72_20675 [Myxococcales bacterium]|nr:hypothetical protein [Myxococcales bacterium]